MRNMIGRNFIVKKCRKYKTISLSHDVIDHVYSKSKLIELHTDLANIEVRRKILIFSEVRYWLGFLTNYYVK